MTKPKLTIGLAHFDDFDGVYFTVTSLALHHALGLNDVELIVVDNSPGSAHGKAVANFLGKIRESWPGVKYIPMPENTGTTQPRERIFAEATGEAVLVMDCHVLLHAGSLQRLLAFYAANPDCKDILSGPLVYDDLRGISTHFAPEWRSEMWGTWATDPRCDPNVWRCPCGKTTFRVAPPPQPPSEPPPPGVEYTTAPPHVHYYGVDDTAPFETMTGSGYGDVIWKQGWPPYGFACGCLPPLPGWGEHEHALRAARYQQSWEFTEPFEIPGQGLGLFTCRRDAWLGFNPHFRGFGGEELYIHEKFRQAGHKALCLPFLRWSHRFGRPGGVRYPLTKYNKVRNYVLGHQELGLDLAPVHEHFVASGLFSQSDWDYLLKDPVAHVEPGKEKSSCGGCGSKAKRAQPSEVAGLDEIFTWAETTPRDLNAHLHTLRELAHNCDHVTEFSKRRETTVALLAGRPKTVVSYNTESDPLFDRLHAAVEKEFTENRRHVKAFTRHAGADSLAVDPIEPTDLLLIHSVHHADRLWAELERHGRQVRRYLALVSTGAFAEKSEDGKGPGLLPAMRRWVKEHPEWSVIHHTDEQWGLTVLSRDARDKPKLPGKIEMAANFAKAITSHVADGAKHVPTEQMEARLEVCSLCPLRADDRCSKCGCFIAEKAKWRSSECPLAKWAPVDAAFVEQSETQPEAA